MNDGEAARQPWSGAVCKNLAVHRKAVEGANREGHESLAGFKKVALISVYDG